MRTLGLFLLFCSTAFAGVRLVNDTAYKLQVVIRAADDTLLGTLEINPQQTMSWNTNSGTTGTIEYFDISQTPYKVAWFCTEGTTETPYSVCTGVATGSTVMANSCDGIRACQKKKESNKKALPGSYTNPTPEELQQQQTEQSAGPPEGMLQ